MRFVSETMKVPEPEIVVTTKGRAGKAIIKYPAANPKDWADEEYEEPEQADDNS